MRIKWTCQLFGLSLGLALAAGSSQAAEDLKAVSYTHLTLPTKRIV